MKKKKALFTAIILLASAPAFEGGAQAQIVMTMEQALEYSEQHTYSPRTLASSSMVL